MDRFSLGTGICLVPESLAPGPCQVKAKSNLATASPLTPKPGFGGNRTLGRVINAGTGGRSERSGLPMVGGGSPSALILLTSHPRGVRPGLLPPRFLLYPLPDRRVY